MNIFLKLLYIVGIFAIVSFGQTDIENENEGTCFCRSSPRRFPPVQTQQGRPGKLGPIGPIGPVGPKGERGAAGVCACNPSEIEKLNRIIQALKKNLEETNTLSPKFYVDYCSVGMKDGRVNDDDITASSFYDSRLEARNGRLDFQVQNNPYRVGAWAARQGRAGEWIQVDLRRPTYVTGVITQGRADSYDQWITSYKIAYANNTSSFQIIQDENGNDVVFSGSMDRNSYVMNRFRQPIIARYFRLIAVSWHGHISGRLEYITC